MRDYGFRAIFRQTSDGFGFAQRQGGEVGTVAAQATKHG
jgi:hypothetical protein